MKARISTSRLMAMAGLVLALALASPFALAARPPGAGGGGGGGGGGAPKGDLYSDLVVLYRSEEGLPILTAQPLNPEVAGDPLPGGTVFCLQPISAAPVPGLDSVQNPADGKQVSLIPLGGTGVAGEECDVSAGTVPGTDILYTALVQEVLFGRLNMGRSPVKVLAQQLREVTTTLAGSTAPIEIDEVGRFVWYDAAGVGIEVDSPGNNLAIHKELQVAGELLAPNQVPIVLPAQANLDGDPTGFLDHAAAALGAAAGKGDLINLDLVVYNNRIIRIPTETTVLDTLTGDGTTGQLNEVYVNYTAAGYAYKRSEVFPGCVRGLLVDFPTAGTYTPFSGTIMDCVFGSIDTSGVCSDGVDFTGGATALHSFAQRADDARAVIAFTHDNTVADSTAILDAEVAGVDQAGQTDVCDALGLPATLSAASPAAGGPPNRTRDRIGQ